VPSSWYSVSRSVVVQAVLRLLQSGHPVPYRILCVSQFLVAQAVVLVSRCSVSTSLRCGPGGPVSRHFRCGPGGPVLVRVQGHPRCCSCRQVIQTQSISVRIRGAAASSNPGGWGLPSVTVVYPLVRFCLPSHSRSSVVAPWPEVNSGSFGVASVAAGVPHPSPWWSRWSALCPSSVVRLGPFPSLSGRVFRVVQ
jgi:hypothetical protein